MKIEDNIKNKKQISAKSKKVILENMVKRIVAVAEILVKADSDTSTETHN